MSAVLMSDASTPRPAFRGLDRNTNVLLCRTSLKGDAFVAVAASAPKPPAVLGRLDVSWPGVDLTQMRPKDGDDECDVAVGGMDRRHLIESRRLRPVSPGHYLYELPAGVASVAPGGVDLTWISVTTLRAFEERGTQELSAALQTCVAAAWPK
jgi:hypothetical protein